MAIPVQIYESEAAGAGSADQTVKVGRVMIVGNSAPAAGELQAGQCAIWFDSTSGSAKLMMYAKQADGTVKTGSVNVAT